MLWDMLWRGSLHHRMITTGGGRATAARTVQSKSEFTFPTIPAIVTATTQKRPVAASASNGIVVAGGICARTLEEPNRSAAEDALDLVRMDDDGGWQMARPPA